MACRKNGIVDMCEVRILSWDSVSDFVPRVSVGVAKYRVTTYSDSWWVYLGTLEQLEMDSNPTANSFGFPEHALERI